MVIRLNIKVNEQNLLIALSITETGVEIYTCQSNVNKKHHWVFFYENNKMTYLLIWILMITTHGDLW